MTDFWGEAAWLLYSAGIAFSAVRLAASSRLLCSQYRSFTGCIVNPESGRLLMVDVVKTRTTDMSDSPECPLLSTRPGKADAPDF
ncbi:hypothetical protein [Sphingomonas sp. dw_22]|uniref:hypothetical protein n=1 Tax=Sphingomonas sp. dw_22 TaxID=2721175 RepID=UPI001BD40426|nr:hypothetical protein [Sphingomonas sp. dw_22]